MAEEQPHAFDTAALEAALPSRSRVSIPYASQGPLSARLAGSVLNRAGLLGFGTSTSSTQSASTVPAANPLILATMTSEMAYTNPASRGALLALATTFSRLFVTEALAAGQKLEITVSPYVNRAADTSTNDYTEVKSLRTIIPVSGPLPAGAILGGNTNARKFANSSSGVSLSQGDRVLLALTVRSVGSPIAGPISVNSLISAGLSVAH